MKDIAKKSAGSIDAAMARINSALDRLETVAGSVSLTRGQDDSDLRDRITALEGERDLLADRHQEASTRLDAAIGRLQKALAD